MKEKRTSLTCDALLFDLDGVLIDSTSCIIRHWTEWAGEHGLEIEKIMQAAHGMRTIETIKLVASHLDAEKEAAKFTAYEETDTAGVTAIKGAGRILDSIPDNAWGIVTSGEFLLAKARLRAAGLPVPKVLISGDMVKEGKPSPEPYLAGLRELKVPAESCVVIEDSPAGVQAGIDAGMRVVGILSTHTWEELRNRGAEFIVDTMQHLDVDADAGEGRLRLILG